MIHKIALVTGGSCGIGAAIAVWLAESGVDVAVGCGHRRAEAEHVATEIDGLGPRAVVVVGDLADPAVPAEPVKQTEADLGLVDILVANADIGTRADARDVDARTWDQAMASIYVPRSCWPRPSSRVCGSSAVEASCSAPPWPRSPAASSLPSTRPRRGRDGLAYLLVGRYARGGVTVNSVAPGLIETDMTAEEILPPGARALPCCRTAATSRSSPSSPSPDSTGSIRGAPRSP
jgi:3-oxoacyl-[acyl-carrier protein] reductase